MLRGGDDLVASPVNGQDTVHPTYLLEGQEKALETPLNLAASSVLRYPFPQRYSLEVFKVHLRAIAEEGVTCSGHHDNEGRTDKKIMKHGLGFK